MPSVDLLDAFAQPQTRRVKSDDLATSRNLRFAFTVDGSFPQTSNSRSLIRTTGHTALNSVVNINAPLGGTFIPGLPNSGVRPLGAEAGNVLEYQATGRSSGILSASTSMAP